MLRDVIRWKGMAPKSSGPADSLSDRSPALLSRGLPLAAGLVGKRTGMTERYPLFDRLRLVMALCVVSGHAFGWQVFPAVPGFLALSGMLVAGSYERSGNWKTFAWRRFIRVYPALLFLFIAAIPLVGLAKVGSIGAYYVSFGFAQSSWNDSLWSLPFEEALYVGLALMFIFGIYRKTATIPLLVGLGLALCLVEAFHPLRMEVARAMPLVWCFGIGNLAHVHRERLPALKFLALPLVILALAIQIWGILHHAGLQTLALASIPAAPGILILGTQFGLGLQKIPDFSYSCYIWHFLLLKIAIADFGNRLFMFPMLIVACAVSWYLIERPAEKLKNRPLRLQFWNARAAKALSVEAV